MYHYVMNKGSIFQGRKGCSVDDLNKHLKTAKSEGKFVSKLFFESNEFFTTKTEEEHFLWTFDDGLLEHYENVLPLLDEYKAFGIFAVPTKIFENRLLKVHKAHILMSELQENFAETFLTWCKKEGINLTEPTRQVLRRHYRWDELNVARVKYLINYSMKNEFVDDVLSLMLEKFIGDESEIAKSFYITKAQMKEMVGNGHLIAGHSHSHRSLTSMSVKMSANDLKRNINILKKNVGTVSAFSFPYGKLTTFNERHIQELSGHGINRFLTTEVGHNFVGSRNLIRRLDPKDRFV